jgi:hypothetical protein
MAISVIPICLAVDKANESLPRESEKTSKMHHRQGGIKKEANWGTMPLRYIKEDPPKAA